jgi:L,D-peptidoglycan transpeptidase YkuD (ErfK/YbiS/YcfS/YnhG family)
MPMQAMRTASFIRLFRALAPAGSGRRDLAWLQVGQVMLACRIGRTGICHAKREGDGATPVGTLRPLRGFWRADRRCRAATRLPMRPLRRDDGWCDAPGHRQYNRLVRLPFLASREEMWRDDHVYDVVLELSWNARPRRQGRGSAIFLHLMNDRRGPTAGCLAVEARRINWLLARLSCRTRILVRY